jgi:hypothetical protein
MLAPGDRELASFAAGYRAGFGSPGLSALTGALVRLLEASDGVADAVTRHDRIGLLRINEDAEQIVVAVNSCAAALSEDERSVVGQTGIPALCERLAAGARRNAFLIEQAWAVDAALMRLLLGFGKTNADGPVGAYTSAPGPAYVDRGA